MAKSLNQAFIKAYRKEKAPTPAEANAPSSNLGEEFIIRLDTVSTPMPAPHLQPRPQTTAASSVQASAIAQPKSVSSPEQEAPPPLARHNIAEQMVRASELQDAYVESLIGGFPSITTVDTNSRSVLATGKSAPLPIEALDQPRENPSPAAEIEQPSWQQTMQTRSGGVTFHEVESDDPIEANRERGEPLATDSADDDATAPALDPPALDPPGSPALSSAEVEKIVENYVQKHGKRGEIFRLDKPTYSVEEAAEDAKGFSAGVLHQDSELLESEVLSGLDEEVPSNTDIDIGISLADERSKRSRDAEDELRRAKFRVFNPVWEVDRLQWPHVCVELMKEREESMLHVAHNLTKACEDGLQVLAVTSPQGGEGRTTVACCLARMAAVSGLRVAFVDGDIENPTLTYQTNLDLEADWKNAIVNQLPIEEVAVHSIDDQITLIPLLAPINEAEIASNDTRIAFMLQQLSESFDLVIVDTGHMESTRTLVTAMAEQGSINAVVTVVDHRISTPQRIQACISRIRRAGISSVGLVENFAA